MVPHLTYHSLPHLVLDGGIRGLYLDEDSYTIFMLRCHEVDNLARAYLEPRLANVESQLMMAINKLQRLEQITLYHTFASVNSAKAVAGLMYESLGHAHLQEGSTLTLKPAIKRKEQKYFHWNFGIVYEELRSVEPNRLHIPKARNQVARAFDSFFILGQSLYIFQFTMANNHDIKKGIEESLSSLVNILPPKRIGGVFITPPGCDVDVKADSEVEKFLGGVTLYSAHLKIEEARSAHFGASCRCRQRQRFLGFRECSFP
jgi:hypothetical protein